MFVHPQTGQVWTHEHGPKGGDEINVVQPGRNYAYASDHVWENYTGTIITRDTDGWHGAAPALLAASIGRRV